MEVEITKQETTKIKVNVTFPIFLKYNGAGDWDRYVMIKRVEYDGSVQEISARSLSCDAGTVFDVERGKWDNKRIAFELGEYMYPGSQEYSYTNDPTEFDALRKEILAALGVNP